MFSYEYYMSAAMMPYIYKQEKMPADKLKRRELTNQIVLALNIVFSLTYPIINYYDNLRTFNGQPNPIKESNFWGDMFLLNRYSVGLLQLVSGVLLLYAVVMIRSFIVEKGMAGQINFTQMTIHAGSFLLYNFSIVFFYGSYLFYFERKKTATEEEIPQLTRTLFISWIVVCYTNFVAQICLVWIFLQFRERQKEEQRAEPKPTIVENCSVTRISSLDTDADEFNKDPELDARSLLINDEPTAIEIGEDDEDFSPGSSGWHSGFDASGLISSIASEDDVKAQIISQFVKTDKGKRSPIIARR